jgi:ribosomal protein L39E
MSIKSPAKKQRLAKKSKQTKWAPFWTVPKIYGKGRRVHPGRHSTKRHWKRNRTEV